MLKFILTLCAGDAKYTRILINDEDQYFQTQVRLLKIHRRIDTLQPNFQSFLNSFAPLKTTTKISGVGVSSLLWTYQLEYTYLDCI